MHLNTFPRKGHRVRVLDKSTSGRKGTGASSRPGILYSVWHVSMLRAFYRVRVHD